MPLGAAASSTYTELAATGWTASNSTSPPDHLDDPLAAVDVDPAAGTIERHGQRRPPYDALVHSSKSRRRKLGTLLACYTECVEKNEGSMLGNDVMQGREGLMEFRAMHCCEVECGYGSYTAEFEAPITGVMALGGCREWVHQNLVMSGCGSVAQFVCSTKFEPRFTKAKGVLTLSVGNNHPMLFLEFFKAAGETSERPLS